MLGHLASGRNANKDVYQQKGPGANDFLHHDPRRLDRFRMSAVDAAIQRETQNEYLVAATNPEPHKSQHSAA